MFFAMRSSTTHDLVRSRCPNWALIHHALDGPQRVLRLDQVLDVERVVNCRLTGRCALHPQLFAPIPVPVAPSAGFLQQPANANGEGQLPLEKLHNGVIAGLRRSNSEQFLEAERSSGPRNCSPR